ncbi:hypothetical protein D3C87_1156710 [compost metagenome]
MDVAHPSREPGARVGRLDLAVHDLAAFVGQAVGGEVLGVDEVPVSGPHSALAKLAQPRPVLKKVRQLLSAIGLHPALRRFQQTPVAPIRRAARQGVHDFKHLFGVVLVRHQTAHGAQRTDGLHARSRQL